MNETYVECMVKQQPKTSYIALKYLLAALTAIVGFFALMSAMIVLLIIAVAFGVLAYLVNQRIYIEYEYLYVDKEITVDKILSQSKRKRVAKYDVEKMEVLAPINSYHLDDYKNRTAKEFDFSSGVDDESTNKYVFYYEGQQKIIIEPSEAFVKAVYNVAPRKVFTD